MEVLEEWRGASRHPYPAGTHHFIICPMPKGAVFSSFIPQTTISSFRLGLKLSCKLFTWWLTCHRYSMTVHSSLLVSLPPLPPLFSLNSFPVTKCKWVLIQRERNQIIPFSTYTPSRSVFVTQWGCGTSFTRQFSEGHSVPRLYFVYFTLKLPYAASVLPSSSASNQQMPPTSGLATFTSTFYCLVLSVAVTLLFCINIYLQFHYDIHFHFEVSYEIALYIFCVCI